MPGREFNIYSVKKGKEKVVEHNLSDMERTFIQPDYISITNGGFHVLQNHIFHRFPHECEVAMFVLGQNVGSVARAHISKPERVNVVVDRGIWFVDIHLRCERGDHEAVPENH
jgi:hypothetical protein